MKIYHNPRCRKSRETLELVRNAGVEPEIVEYLKNPLSESEIQFILSSLKISALELVRKNDSLYKEKFKNETISEKEWVKILSQNPILMERPIVVKESSVIIGRPPENVLKMLS